MYFLIFFFFVRVMMFVVGLPVAQIVLFCLSVGRDPYGLHLAVVNHESNRTTCPPTDSCDLTQLSCQYLHQIVLRRQKLVSNAQHRWYQYSVVKLRILFHVSTSINTRDAYLFILIDFHSYLCIYFETLSPRSVGKFCFTLFSFLIFSIRFITLNFLI